MIDTQKLRDALQRIPRQKWSKHRATVNIPETEDFAGIYLSISGLSKIYARALAGYIAAANPDATAALIDTIDAQASETARLREALTDAQKSLNTIAILGGSEADFMGTLRQVREYANSRARVARAALTQEPKQEDQS